MSLQCCGFCGGGLPLEPMQIMGESHPWMAVFLPHRECRLLEIPVSKTANRNSVNIRNHFEFPIHCAAAIWAKMLADFAIIQSVADIDLPGVPDFYLWPFIISANSKHRTRPALTLSAVAGQNKRRFARSLNAQSAATTVSSPGHDCDLHLKSAVLPARPRSLAIDWPVVGSALISCALQPFEP